MGSPELKKDWDIRTFWLVPGMLETLFPSPIILNLGRFINDDGDGEDKAFILVFPWNVAAV